MKKGIILAIVVVAAIAAPAFDVAFHNHVHEQGVCKTRCLACNGTGFCYGPKGKGTGNYPCTACKGTGFIGN